VLDVTAIATKTNTGHERSRYLQASAATSDATDVCALGNPSCGVFSAAATKTRSTWVIAPPWGRLVVFNAVDGLGVAVQLASLWLLTRVAPVHYLIATLAAVAVAVVHNFIWHRRWMWRDRGLVSTFARFAVANGLVSLTGNPGVMATLVSGAHANPIAASGAAIVVCGFLNFWLGDAVVFAERIR
jgi:putative flippase GtrA